MNIEFIEAKFDEIFKELESEVMEVLNNQSLDKKQTNLRMKPLTTTKKILLNALDSIKLAQKVADDEINKKN
jgi:hypothetical protein